MAIAGFDDDGVKQILSENLTPSDSIKEPERLFGRHKYLKEIDRALSSPGRQIFVYGDRGVGKTSLALTAAHIHNSSENSPIHVNCGKFSTFSQVMQSMALQSVPVEQRLERAGNAGGFNFSALGFGAGKTPASPTNYSIPVPNTVEEALDLVRYIDEKSNKKSRIVVVDEMERINSREEKEKFAEFIKNVPSASTSVKFIFCGIASDVSELLGFHPSAGRILESIKLDKLHHDFLWKIISTPASKFGIEIPAEFLLRIGRISDGFPHYVHLIGESLFWSIVDDEAMVTVAENRHYESSIKGALARTEPVLRHQFDLATKKTKNTEDYEEALWSLADTTSDRRQLTDIYDNSYMRIMYKRIGRSALAKEKLNQRLLALKKDSHGRIVVGHGSGWFSYRENIMRGYARLDAENRGIEIGTS